MLLILLAGGGVIYLNTAGDLYPDLMRVDSVSGHVVSGLGNRQSRSTQQDHFLCTVSKLLRGNGTKGTVLTRRIYVPLIWTDYTRVHGRLLDFLSTWEPPHEACLWRTEAESSPIGVDSR